MKFFDLALGLMAAVVLLGPLMEAAVLVRLTSSGSALYWSEWVGQYNKIFKMPKFRSMREGTPAVATNLLANPKSHLTPIGCFPAPKQPGRTATTLEHLVGDMSFVGSRPALFNQHYLIELRTQKNVHTLVPALTCLAQVNGCDDIPIPQKVELDAEYCSALRTLNRFV